MTSKWERTNGPDGYRPKFPITCRYCEGPMVMRFSEADFDKGRPPQNHIGYKCPECAWIARFEIQDDKEYLLETVRRRGGALHFVPDMDAMGGDDERIAKQLEALGYMGGR